MINISKTDDIDGFLLCYKNAKATLCVIDKFFKHYPNGTIYLHSDNGCDYSNLIYKYANIVYTHHTYQVHPFRMNFLKSVEWSKRLYASVKQSTKKYFILLEDDVWIEKRVSIQNEHNMVGTDLGRCFNHEQFRNIKTYEPLKDMPRHYSGCGGCIFEADIIRKQLLNNIIDMIQHYCSIDYLWGDQLLSLMIYLGGGTLGIDEYYSEHHLQADICHGQLCKIYYNENLNPDEQHLINCHTINSDPWANVFIKK